jgi:dTMP kinase
MKGLFITFEGGEGSGKTTQINLLSEWFKTLGILHVKTKEPGSPHVPECVKLRSLLLDTQNNLTPISELMLFLADRALHVEKYIKPMLESGKHVVCDRYIDSTRVYQGISRGLGRVKLDSMLEFVTNGLLPDLTFVIDILPEVGLARAQSRGNVDRIEEENIEFHIKVRQGFLKLAESLMDQNRIIVINANEKSIEEVHKEIIEHITKKLWVKPLQEVLDV